MAGGSAKHDAVRTGMQHIPKEQFFGKMYYTQKEIHDIVRGEKAEHGSPDRRHRRASQEDVRLHERLHHWRPRGLGKDTPGPELVRSPILSSSWRKTSTSFNRQRSALDEAGRFEDSDPCVDATLQGAGLCNKLDHYLDLQRRRRRRSIYDTRGTLTSSNNKTTFALSTWRGVTTTEPLDRIEMVEQATIQRA
jgi:hypothetical protein